MSAKASGLQVSRREFLEVAAVTGFLVASDQAAADVLGAELPTHRIRIRRARDFLNLDLSFVNFDVRGNELYAVGGGRSLIIVRFPPQNLAEAIFDKQPPKPGAENAFENAPLPLPIVGQSVNSPIPPIRAFLSGPSQIVFMVPDGMRLPFRDDPKKSRSVGSFVDRWLRCMSEWKIRVPRSAQQPTLPVSFPKADESFFEIPFRLFIAPTSSETRWQTSSDRMFGIDPPTSRIQVLWHAELLSNLRLTPAQLPPDIDPSILPPELLPPTDVSLQTRAVFSPDYRADGKPPSQPYFPGKLQLSHRSDARHMLVKQMAAGDGLIDVEHLVLSALGANASLDYFSTKTFNEIKESQIQGKKEFESGNLAIWKHRMVVGRDVFLLDVRPGFLFPFVYPALAVELTRRQFAAYELPGKKGFSAGSYLLKERFIIVVDPLKQFCHSGSTTGRGMPLKKARLVERRSPLLANWGNFRIECDCEPSAFQNVLDRERIRTGLFFVPRVLEDTNNPGADGLRWNIEFEDEAKKTSKTSNACLLFAGHVVIGRQLWQALRRKYRCWSVPAQPIAFAPEKAELSFLVPKESRDKNGVPVSAGDVLFRHTLEDEERLAARTLAEVIRDAWQTLDGNQKWAAFKNLITSTQGDVQKFADTVAKLGGLTDPRPFVTQIMQRTRKETLAQLGDAIETIDDQIKKGIAGPQDTYEDLLRQLQRAEQVSSTLETHMLAFDCGQVDKLFDAAGDSLVKALAESSTVDAFKAKLAGITKTLDDADKFLQWGSRIDRELANRLNGLKTWDNQHREIDAYIQELQDAKKQATNFGEKYFHAQLAEAEAAIPALKALGPGMAIQPIRQLDDYLAKGMGDLAKGLTRVQNGAFAKLVRAIDQGTAMADQVRSAVARPAAIVSGLSRDVGALIGDRPDAIDKLARQVSDVAPNLKPTFEDLKNAIPDAKLFSVLPIREIIKILASKDGLASAATDFAKSQLPTINLVNLPDHFENVWEWTTPVDSKTFGILDFKVADGGRATPVSLHISSVTRIDMPKIDVSVDPTNPQHPVTDPATITAGKKLHGTSTIKGFLGFWDEQSKQAAQKDSPAFDIIILGMIDVAFNSVEFEATGTLGESPKTSIKPDMGDVTFLGPLKFVMTLQQYLKDLLGDNFQVDLTPSYIRVGFKSRSRQSQSVSWQFGGSVSVVP